MEKLLVFRTPCRNCEEDTFQEQNTPTSCNVKCLLFSVDSVLRPLAILAAPMEMELIEDVRVVEGTARYPGAVWFVNGELDWNRSCLKEWFDFREKILLRVCPPSLMRSPEWTILYPTEKVKLEKSSDCNWAEFANVVLMSIGDWTDPQQSE